MIRRDGGIRRDDVLSVLRAHREGLTAFGVRSLALFGSVARDEAGPESDIDILVEFDGPATFDNYIDLKVFLEDTLGAPVDLVMRKALRPRIAPVVDRAAIRVA